ncbi:MAG: cysteine peptidase family C39 domain-containing protein [Thermoguttaceae bacterium]
MRLVVVFVWFVYALGPVAEGSASSAQGAVHDWETFDAGEAQLSCGPRALFIWLQLLGHEVRYDEVAQCLPIGDKGVSLEDLAEAARRWLTTTRVIKVAPGDLDRIPLPAVAHGWFPGQSGTHGHYVVVVKVGRKAVVCLDGGGGLAQEVSRSEFESFWSGYLLAADNRVVMWTRYSAAVGLSILLVGVIVTALGSVRLWRRGVGSTAVCKGYVFDPYRRN